MSFLRTAVVSALAALLLVGTPAYLSAHPGNNQTLHFFEHFVNNKSVNIFTGSDKRGNYEVFHNPVFDSTDRKQIGYTNGSCIFTTNTMIECNWSVTFQDGSSISITGPDVDDQDTVYAVTGGTGVYSHIQGEAKVHFIKTLSGMGELEYHIVS